MATKNEYSWPLPNAGVCCPRSETGPSRHGSRAQPFTRPRQVHCPGPLALRTHVSGSRHFTHVGGITFKSGSRSEGVREGGEKQFWCSSQGAPAPPAVALARRPHSSKPKPEPHGHNSRSSELRTAGGSWVTRSAVMPIAASTARTASRSSQTSATPGSAGKGRTTARARPSNW